MKIFYKRHLPHIQPPGATIFITFRLFGSLPSSIVEEIMNERQLLKKKLNDLLLKEKESNKYFQLLKQYQKLTFKFDSYLHSVHNSPFYLKIPEIAKLVADSITFWGKKRFELLVYCIMPNHVHLVLTPLKKSENEYFEISKIMHSIKSFSANKANEILKRKGKRFWQHENFDHYCRNEIELENIIRYVLENPKSAGLIHDPRNWPWSYYKYPW